MEKRIYQPQINAEHFDNRVLSQITLITSLGDHLSFFAMIKLLMDTGLSVLVAGYSVVIKTAAIGLAGIFLPYIVSNYSTRRLIRVSQWFSFVVLAAVIVAYLTHTLTAAIVFGAVFAQTFLKQIFDSAREYHSKATGESSCQVTLQSQLLSSLYSAQFFGPLISLFLIAYFRIEVPLFFDAASFLVAGAMTIMLKHSVRPVEKLNILAPLKYLPRNTQLLKITLFRSVGFWFSISLFNYLLFAMVSDRFSLGIEKSAWIYSIIGLGATIAMVTIRNPMTGFLTKLGEIPEGYLAFFGQGCFGLALFGFIAVPSFAVSVAVLFFAGLGMGMNAVGTQALRRKLSTSDQFPEVVGIETIIARSTDVLIASLAGFTIARGWMTAEIWLGLAGLNFILCGAAHLGFVKLDVNATLKTGV